MIFKHPDTVPQMRSKPIHFHKKAKNIFGNIVVQTDKIIFASDIFVKHFCWDFQTCLSQIFLPTRGPGGPPWMGGPPISRNQSPPAETSRNQSPSAIGGGGGPPNRKNNGPGGGGAHTPSRNQPISVPVSHGGRGGTLSAGKSLAQGGWGQLPGGGAHRAPPPTPLQLENSWPRRQLPGAYGGGPQRGVPYRPGSVNSYGLGLGNSGIVYKQIGKGIVFERDFWKGFLKRLLGELRINASYFWENDFQKNPTLSPKCVPNQSIFTNKPKHIFGHIVVEKIR